MPSKRELQKKVQLLEARIMKQDQENEFRRRSIEEDVKDLTDEVFPRPGNYMLRMWGSNKKSQFDSLRDGYNERCLELEEKLELLADHLGVYFTAEDANYAVVKKKKGKK